MPKPFAPMSESAVLRLLLLHASELGARLFRNPRGVERIAQKDCRSCQRFGRVLTYGLHNGAPDLVGWMPHIVTAEDVGRTLAVFVGIEAKRESGGTVSEDQRRFLFALEQAGAIQGVCRSVADLAEVLSPTSRASEPAQPLLPAVDAGTTGE